MRIQSVIPNIFAQRSYQNNHYDYSAYRLPVSKPDSFSFQGKAHIIKTAKDFRQHAIESGMHCMYCHIPFKFDESLFNKWIRGGMFSTNIGEFVKNFKKIKPCLHDSEKDIFSFVEFVAKTNPDVTLDTVIKIMSVNANTQLLETQLPIFDAIINKSKKLPKEYQNKIATLIEKSKKRMLHIPYVEEFSGKELNYKITKLTKTISDEKLSQKIDKYAELLTIPSIQKSEEPLTEKVIKRVLKTLDPKFKVNKKENLEEKYTRDILRKMIVGSIKDSVSFMKRKDLYNLCVSAEKELNGEPILRKFTNRAFAYDLNEALLGLEGNPVRKKLFDLANQLPTSETNVYAFITKHDQSSSEKIAYDLFTPSEVTLEHMKPRSAGGENLIYNFAVACKRCNNKRQSDDMREFYKMFDKNNAQYYWNDIIREANKGYFDYNDVKEMLKVFKSQSHKRIDAKALKKPKY